MNKILVFGGSFSPPTLAHEEIIRQCLALPGFDEVWLMPSADRDDKSMSASEADRLAMLKIVKDKIFADDKRLKICDVEYKLPKPTKLVATEGALRRTFPSTEFWFAFGGDSFSDMPNWPDGERMQGALNLVVFSDKKPAAADQVRVLHFTLPAKFSKVSSSAVRSGDQAVSEHVKAYIDARGLYT